MSWIDHLKFDEKGLIPAVIQDCENNEVLMLGYMNKQALEKTLKEGRTYFYSRSRKNLWAKGETSGHTQTVKAIYLDCDMDCVLVKVQQKVAACHTGYRSCFYRQDKDGKLQIVGKKVFEPDKVYHKNGE